MAIAEKVRHLHVLVEDVASAADICGQTLCTYYVQLRQSMAAFLVVTEGEVASSLFSRP